MAQVTYDPASTMREARAAYFEANAFGDDGGYGDAWADIKIGPLPFPIRNTAGRVRALKFHDLHHVLTGYDTDLLGEFEISAWELGAGCRDFAFAWVINLSGVGGGLFLSPRRMWRAFVRGRRSRSLYGSDLETLLDTTVAAARSRLVEGTPGSSLVDGALFAGTVALSAVVGTAFVLFSIPLVPIGLVVLNAARRRATAQ